MANIYLLKWNNYYNRKVKSISLSEIKDVSFTHLLAAKSNINFNPNDDVNTSLVINYPETYGMEMPDYIVVGETVKDGKPIIGAGGNEILASRWFITEAKRNCFGQWEYFLQRDVIVDFYNNIISADCFIKKAIVPPTNAFIFNNEGLDLNQIKTSEKLLKDLSGCPWIIGYYDGTNIDSGTTVMSASVEEKVRFDFAINGLFSTWAFYGNTSSNKIKEKAAGLRWKCGYTQQLGGTIHTFPKTYIFNDYAPELTEKQTGTYDTSYAGGYTSTEDFSGADIYWAMWLNQNRNAVANATNNLFGASNQWMTLLSYNNKIIRCSDGNGGYLYYKITVHQQKSTYQQAVSNTDALFQYLKAGMDSLPNTTGAANNNDFVAFWTGYEYWYSAVQLNLGSSIDVNIDEQRYTLEDAPYSMFAIPYGNITVKNAGGADYTVDKDAMFSVACELIKKYGGNSAKLYDVQLLPYCPIQRILSAAGEIDLASDTLLYDNITQTKGGATTNIGIVCYAQVSSFSFNIFETISVVNVKIENECSKYRLVSPNFNGQFEFNAARNGGVDFFNVDCSYKPYQPYIHINPNFSSLYGEDFNDARGLICGGDFSLPAMSDAWATYERQNKNYNDIFNRQIENLEVNQGLQRIESAAGALFGAFSGAVSGASAGASIGGGVGAGVGAVVGGLASAAGGVVDIELLKRRQEEEMSFRKDEHVLQLGNIKALPASLTKVSAFNYNNKIFPILEHYTCTDIERETVAKKIVWEGMTINAFGKIEDYIINSWSYGDNEDKGYIQAEIIRIDEISEDFHIVAAIAKELAKGVYFK